jgi:S-formylglutathione hydrolase
MRSSVLATVESHRCFGGTQSVYLHNSESTRSPMRVGVFQPEGEGPFPVLYFLSGLTCTEQNFITKAAVQRYAAEVGMMVVAPDTSPREVDLPGADESYDFGTGASFYLDATEPPWASHYRMYSYVTHELPKWIAQHLPADTHRQGICGHSMGGHGALMIGIKNPDVFRSVSAFSPICAPMQCPWGQKAFQGYLGSDAQAWAQYDSVELIKARGYARELLVDLGSDDPFVVQQLKPELLQAACRQRNVRLSLRWQSGYDHSYYFISTFIKDHVRFHSDRLR